MYIVGTSIIGGLACSEIDSASEAPAILFTSSIFPGAIVVAATAISGLSGIGAEAAFDGSAPIRIGAYTTPRLLNTSLGPTFIGHTSLLALVVLAFGWFQTRSNILRATIAVVGLGYGAVLIWSGTRTALFAGWISTCGTLLLFAMFGRRRTTRHRAIGAMLVVLFLPWFGKNEISDFVYRSSTNSAPDLTELYESARGKYRDNTYRWIGDGHSNSIWGAGLGANTVITRDIMDASTIQKNSGYGLIEPFLSSLLLNGVVWADSDTPRTGLDSAGSSCERMFATFAMEDHGLVWLHFGCYTRGPGP